MACCGLCWPYPAAASLVRSAESGLSGAWSSSRSIIVMIISTCASSSVPMARSMSLYLPGSRQFQPCSRYWVATVISPHCPPRTSCILRAKSGSGPSGLASNCSAWVCVNTASPRLWMSSRARRHRLPAPPAWAAGAEGWPPGANLTAEGSAVGQQDPQREDVAVGLPDDVPPELLGLAPDRPKPEAGQVRGRRRGVEVAQHPRRALGGLDQDQLQPAGAAGRGQPHRCPVAVPVGVLEQVAEDAPAAGGRDPDV